MTTVTLRRVINADFANMRADGRVIAPQCAFAPLQIGDLVVLRDDAEGMRFDGQVTGMSEDGHRLYVTMDWE